MMKLVRTDFLMYCAGHRAGKVVIASHEDCRVNYLLACVSPPCDDGHTADFKDWKYKD